MEEKLVNLFLKFIEKSKSVNDISIRNRQVTCVYDDNGDKHTIFIKPYADTIDANQQKYNIHFQELIESTNHEKYSKILNAAEDRIEDFEKEEKFGQVYPNYNPASIPIIEAKARELGITDLQHAENGGEYHIKELGYWVDGYSKEKNIVIEYDEPHHKRQSDKDVIREKEIIEHLNCEFIRIIQK